MVRDNFDFRLTRARVLLPRYAKHAYIRWPAGHAMNRQRRLMGLCMSFYNNVKHYCMDLTTKDFGS